MSKLGIFFAIIFIICAVIVSGYVIGVTYEEDLYKKGNELYSYTNQREYTPKGLSETSFEEENLKIYDNGGYIYTFLGTETLKSGKLSDEDLELLLSLSEKIKAKYYYDASVYDENITEYYDINGYFGIDDGESSKIFKSSKNKWIEIYSNEKYNTSECVDDIEDLKNKLLDECRDKTNALSVDGFVNFYKEKIEFLKTYINNMKK